MQQQPQQMYLQQVPGYFQHPQAAAAAAAASASPYQPGQNVLVLNGFDSGARFDGISQPNIPPPPPGVAPNAAQLAAASGAHVAVSQKKGGFLSGGSGGGYTIF
ncbi:DAZ-associated protein 2 [Portunus trituberculatus]|uniref:DAZ-associated protein 2 n=2 Tax=Portunus trituberculatus TaxID=210409 RepID=A0A5B7CNZ3_PORTR|nr:DAZ-associated protein 2 [Portunus trituberculatus]